MIEKVIKVLQKLQEERNTYLGYDYLEDKDDEVVIDMTINKIEFDKIWRGLQC